MRRLILGAVIAALLIAPVQSAAAGHSSYIRTNNETKDAWAWITVYSDHLVGRKIQGAYCVAPGQKDEHGFNGVYAADVRAEVTHSGCKHPVMLDRTLGTKGGRHNTPIVTHFTGIVAGGGGHYTFSASPY